MAYLGKTPSQAVRSRYYYTATGGETSLSGADDNSNVLTFTDGNYVDVSLNGVALVAGTDYNTTTTNTIGGLTALVASDVVEVIVYDTFSVFGGNMAADLNFKDNVKANFGTGNDLQIFHDGSNSIIRDAGTGSLKFQYGTSDGVVFDSSGRVGIGTTSPNNQLEIKSDTATVVARLACNTGSGRDWGLASATDGIFGVYDYDASSYRMTIDSSGNVGIGGSPTKPLTVFTSAATDSARFTDNTNSEFFIKHSSGNLLTLATGSTSQPMAFGQGSTEAMRISGGNLLVGKTSTAIGTVGFRVDGANGFATITRDGYESLILNRKTSDGDIAKFQKDGTTVGSIGTVSSKLTIGSGATGVRFNYAGIDTISPWNVSTNALTDGTTSLGYSNTRFQDLYLSGGVYLGGTGSANYLEDYEEGTWVPTIQGSTTNPSGISYSIQDGTYTKIGRMVYVMFRVRFSFTSGTGAGNLEIAGLPVASTNYAQPKSPPQHDNLSFTGFEYIEMGANANTAQIGLAKNRSGSSASSLNLSDCNPSFTDINGGLFYFTS